MIPQTTELSQIQAAFIDKDNRIEELMRQINSAQSLLNSLKKTTNSLVGDGKITIKTYAGSNVGDFTVNQKEDKTITLPQQATVNNGTLTIQKNGTSVGTFTANQSGDTTANITVPTKTSEITNDSEFVTGNDVLLKTNNLSDLQSATSSIDNLIANSETSGIFTSNAKFPIKNPGVSQSNPTGVATIGDLIAYLKSKLFEVIHTTIDLTGTSQNNMVSIDMDAANNTVYEVAIRGELNNSNLNGSAILRTFNRLNYVNQHNIPVWYNFGQAWYNVTINFAGAKVRFFSASLQQSLYVTVIKHLL